jgi:hypothetical protein
MTPQEAVQLVFEAAKLRMPTFRYDPHGSEPAHSPQQKIIALEDYLLQSAAVRGQLEEARVYMNELQHTFVVEWEKLAGWEVNLPGGKKLKDATQADIATAKRNARPDLWENLSDVKNALAQLGNQVRRLEHDDDVASRAYTFIVGS